MSQQQQSNPASPGQTPASAMPNQTLLPTAPTQTIAPAALIQPPVLATPNPATSPTTANQESVPVTGSDGIARLRCFKCKKWKGLSQFTYDNLGAGATGYRHNCLDCRMKRRASDNKSRIRKRQLARNGGAPNASTPVAPAASLPPAGAQIGGVIGGSAADGGVRGGFVGPVVQGTYPVGLPTGGPTGYGQYNGRYAPADPAMYAWHVPSPPFGPAEASSVAGPSQQDSTLAAPAPGPPLQTPMSLPGLPPAGLSEIPAGYSFVRDLARCPRLRDWASGATYPESHLGLLSFEEGDEDVEDADPEI